MGVFTDIVNVVVNVNGEKSSKSLKDLKKDARQLRRELDNLIPGTEEFKKKMEELKRVEARLRAVQNEIRGVGGAFARIKDEIRQFGILAVSYMGFEFITDSIKNIVSKNARLSDELADIRKTTGMTQEEVERLNKSLSKIDTRTATSELRQIAAVAGQLGIASADVLAFTKATDKLVVALGDEFTGGAEQVTKELGALRNIFSDIATSKIDEDMLHIGNALNELGAAGSATAPVVTDFASRIGGVAIPLGLSSAQVLALSATMQELNVSAEVGGTAVGKILQKMTTNVKEFADVANVDINEFAKLVNTDLYGAFIKVTEGAKNSGTSATKLGSILEGLGLTGAGASQVFLKLGSNTGLLNSKLKLSQESLKSTDSIMGEFNVKNETFAAKLEKISRRMSDAFANSAVAKGLENTVDWINKLLEQPLEEKLRDEQREFNKMYAQLLNNNLAQKDRVSLIQSLQGSYPEYLKNIRAETVSNKELYAALDKVNEMLVNKRLLMDYENKMNEAADKAKDKLANKINMEANFLEKTLAIKQTWGYKIKEGLDPFEQFIEANKFLGQVLQDNKPLWDSNFGWMREQNMLYIDGNRAIEMYRKTLQENADAQAEFNKEAEIYNQKKKLLGLDSPGVEEIPYNAKTPQERLKEVDYYLSNLESRYRDRIASSSESDAELKKIEAEKFAEKVMLEQERNKILLELQKGNSDDVISETDNTESQKLERLRQSIADMANALRLSQLDERNREIEAVNIKYDKLAEDAKNYAQESLEIEALRNAELLELNRKFAKEDEQIEQERLVKKIELEEQVRFMLMSERDKELYDLMRHHEQVNEQLINAGVDASTLYESQQRELFEIAQKWNEKAIEAEKQKNLEIKKKQEEALRDRIDNVEAQAGVASSLASALTSMFDVLGNESADYVKFQKRLALIQIGIDTASAIAKLVVMSQANPLNAVTGGIAGIAQYAAGFAQIMGNISKARKIWEESGDVPEYAEGGILPGPSHSQGGMSVYNGRRKVAEIEGYEAMIPRDTTAANPLLIAALLRAKGKKIDALAYSPQPISYSTATTAVRFNNSQSTNTPVFSKSSDSTSVMNEVYSVLKHLNKQLDDGIIARMVYDQYTRDTSAIEFAKKSAQLGKR